MAKTSKKNRKRNARRQKRALAATMRGEAPARNRDPQVYGMWLRYRNTNLTVPDRKKEASRSGARGRIL